MTTNPARAQLRTMIDSGQLVVAPGVFDGLSAHLAARTGHSAAYLTGAGVAASGFGLPDLGLVTQTEMVERARMIVRVLDDVPLIADADTGFGGALNVVRTVREYEATGVAAIHLEDQAFPKKCGHLPNKELVSTEEFVVTLKAAADARVDDGMLLIARTDARGPLGLDEAIDRANRYAEAGADVVFVEAPQGVEEVERVAAEVKAPLLLNLVVGGLTPMESADRLAELGFAIAIHPGVALGAAAMAMLSGLADLAGTDPMALAPTGPGDFFDLVGMAEWAELGERLRSGAAADVGNSDDQGF